MDSIGSSLPGYTYCGANQERPIRARVSGLVSVKHAVASTPKMWKIAINRVSACDEGNGQHASLNEFL